MSHFSQTVDGQEQEIAPQPFLERRLELTSVSWYTVAWIAVLLLAALPRLIGWSNWPLSAEEATIASDALAIVQGNGISDQALRAPLTTGLTALAIFLFGATDTAARIMPLLLGFGTLGIIYLLAPRIGRGTSLGAAFVVALSPTLVAASREVSAAGVLVTATLLALWLGMRFFASATSGRGILLGAALAALVLADPLGWIAVLMITGVAYRFVPKADVQARDSLPVLLGFLATLVVISTFIFTELDGVTRFLGESLTSLWELRVEPLGERWYLMLFQLIVDEGLVVLLALYALLVMFFGKRRRLRLVESLGRSVIAEWAGISLLLGILLGSKDLTLHAFILLPMALLAGNGLHQLLSSIKLAVLPRREGLLFIMALLLAFLAAGSLAGLLLGNANDSVFDWLFKFVVVGLLVLAPALTALLWLRPRLEGSAGPLVLCLGMVIVAGLALRTSVMLSDTSINRPGEILNAGNATPAVSQIVGRIERLSRDTTTFEQDIRDPTGGHGLRIKLDATIDQPFGWYLRDFPNVTIFTPNDDDLAQSNPDLIIISNGDSRTAATEEGDFVGRTYALKTTLPASFTDPSWSTVFRTLVDPEELRDFFRFLVDRQVISPHPPEEFRLVLSSDLATRVYGPTVP